MVHEAFPFAITLPLVLNIIDSQTALRELSQAHFLSPVMSLLYLVQPNTVTIISGRFRPVLPIIGTTLKTLKSWNTEWPDATWKDQNSPYFSLGATPGIIINLLPTQFSLFLKI